MPHRWSIRWWLASLVAVVALPLTLLLTLGFLAQQRSEPREAQKSALHAARVLAMRFRALHADSLALLDGMAVRPGIANFDGHSCDSLFAIVDFVPQYLNLVLFDRSGQVVCSGVPQIADAAVSSSAIEWIREELRNGRVRSGVPLIRPVRNRWVSAVARPVAGRFQGTLILVALPDVVDRDLSHKGNVVTIFDARGTVVARTGDPEKWVGRNMRGSAFTELVLREKEGNTEARGVDGISRQYGFASLPEIGWSIAVGVPTAAVVGPLRAEFRRDLAGGALIVVILISVAAVMSRAIGRPIDALAHAATSVAHGGYGKVTVEGPREVSMLAEAFNKMVENRSRVEHEMLESERTLKALSDRLLVVQEQERTHIAREIHDDLGQALTALKMDVIGLMERTNDTSAAGAAIRKRVLTTLDATVNSVQRIAAELRPSILDDLGLAAAIESEAQSFEERTGIECEVSLPAEGRTVSNVVATAVYRIIQEALTNVARHSNAARVELRVRFRDSDVVVEVRDDGRGITSQEVGSARSLGLIGIRERAELVGGTARFEGIAGRGTIVSIRIPMPETAP